MTSTTLSNQWLTFLTQQGFTVVDRHSHFTNASSPNESNGSDGSDGSDEKVKLIPLTHYTAYSLNGPDGENFLQGQTSCNIGKLSTTQSLIGANTNPKGSVINFFRLMKVADEQLLLRFPNALAEQAAANINKYIVFSKADFTAADENWVGIGLQGDDAADLVSKVFGDSPKEDHQQLIIADALIIKQVGNQTRFEIWLPVDQAESTWNRLKEKASPAGTDAWLLEDMASGIAIMDKHSQEQFIPQMLNLHMISAVDFHKGCYTGQEIITRLQYRGKLNKCLFRAEVTSAEAVSVGTNLWSPQRQQAGEVISVVAKGDNVYEVQIVIHIKTAEDSLKLTDENGAELTLLPMPYEVDPEWRPEEPK